MQPLAFGSRPRRCAEYRRARRRGLAHVGLPKRSTLIRYLPHKPLGAGDGGDNAPLQCRRAVRSPLGPTLSVPRKRIALTGFTVRSCSVSPMPDTDASASSKISAKIPPAGNKILVAVELLLPLSKRAPHR